MKVLLFTSQDIGFQIVEALSKKDGLELFVIADRTSRDEIYGYRCAIEACKKLGISWRKASRIDDKLKNEIATFAPEMIISAYFPHIIPQAVLSLSKIPPINVHPGKLPEYRGKFPTPWYILNGEREFGVAIHEIDAGIDTGAVHVQEFYDLPASITGHELYALAMNCGADLLVSNIDKIAGGTSKPRKQLGVGSYYSSIEKTYQINWSQPRENIARRIRVHAKPYLPAHSQLFNCMVYINKASLIEVPNYTAQIPGRILSLEKGGAFVVSCADGCLLIEEYETTPSLSEQSRSLHFKVGNQFV